MIDFSVFNSESQEKHEGEDDLSHGKDDGD